jgi:beta-glucanase (GH16 family)
VYGPWPVSGEIDIMESRGNPFLFSGSTPVGVQEIGSTLHFGPKANIDAWRTAHGKKSNKRGYDKDFHLYRVIWTPNSLKFEVDNEKIVTINADKGFFKRGNFSDQVYSNPWVNGTSMAPFDQYFYLIINLAIGGTNFFSDSFTNKPHKKPVSF